MKRIIVILSALMILNGCVFAIRLPFKYDEIGEKGAGFYVGQEIKVLEKFYVIDDDIYYAEKANGEFSKHGNLIDREYEIVHEKEDLKVGFSDIWGDKPILTAVKEFSHHKEHYRVIRALPRSGIFKIKKIIKYKGIGMWGYILNYKTTYEIVGEFDGLTFDTDELFTNYYNERLSPNKKLIEVLDYNKPDNI